MGTEDNLHYISEILQTINNQNFKIIRDFSFLATAPSEDISFLPLLFRLRSIDFFNSLLEHPENVAGIICPFEIAEEVSRKFPVIATDATERLFWTIHNKMYKQETVPTTIGIGCVISDRAILSKHGVSIGNRVTIEENVIIREGVSIGDDCIVRAGCIIGGEGFQHYKDKSGVLSVKHLGKVHIGNNVEIQYNSCIDKALYWQMSTIVEDNCRLDNLVQVGHAAHLGKGVFAASGVVFGGYVEIGDDCFIGLNAAIRQHVKIGMNSLVGMNSAIIKDAGANQTIAGFPARIIDQK